MTPPTTKDRILDAAEKLFAERGFDGTSLRAVTEEAEANLAAVSYHFGGKLRLFQAVFERRVGGINQERLQLLDRAEREAGEGEPTLEALLEALLAPALRLAAHEDEGYQRFMRLAGRAHSARGEHVQAIKQVFHDVHQRFVPAFRRALPHLGEPDLFWRMHFLLGSMTTHMADPRRIHHSSEGLCPSEDPEKALRQLVAFAAGALRAPAVEPSPMEIEG